MEGFGETAGEILCSRLYPVYFNASITEGENWLDSDEVDSEEKKEVALGGINEALAKERTRQGGEIKEPEISDDPEAAHLQKAGLDLPKTMAERTAKEHRHRQFQTDKVQ